MPLVIPPVEAEPEHAFALDNPAPRQAKRLRHRHEFTACAAGVAAAGIADGEPLGPLPGLNHPPHPVGNRVLRRE
jgi:hypothetical protein